jgi:hypothetical protein
VYGVPITFLYCGPIIGSNDSNRRKINVITTIKAKKSFLPRITYPRKALFSAKAVALSIGESGVTPGGHAIKK